MSNAKSVLGANADTTETGEDADVSLWNLKGNFDSNGSDDLGES